MPTPVAHQPIHTTFLSRTVHWPPMKYGRYRYCFVLTSLREFVFQSHCWVVLDSLLPVQNHNSNSLNCTEREPLAGEGKADLSAKVSSGLPNRCESATHRAQTTRFSPNTRKQTKWSSRHFTVPSDVAKYLIQQNASN